MFRTRSTLLIAIALLMITASTATAASKVLITKSSQVKNGSLDAADLSAKARKSLQGTVGPAGPADPAGPAGVAGPAGAPGATGARGPAEAFLARAAGINTPTCPAQGCDPGATLRTLTVPAGSYLVTASADLAAATFVAETTRSIECHVERGDTGTFQRTLHLYRTGPGAGTSDQTVDVTWALTLPQPTTLSLTCSVGAVKFNAANARITALQIGSLTETVS